ncbi:unnamed protein product [Pleuronectes platessa]|uniref:Uncharacterized protein n=1 Tax=Pleuronectes platessa TaxID=8262 RepID=A0A9N7Y7D6_PLEPL|nr:unnamed protein product [Pleuronectes platessa]
MKRGWKSSGGDGLACYKCNPGARICVWDGHGLMGPTGRSIGPCVRSNPHQGVRSTHSSSTVKVFIQEAIETWTQIQILHHPGATTGMLHDGATGASQ